MNGHLYGWIVTALCLAGTVLNVRRSRLCFHLWMAGNALWLARDVSDGLYFRAFLDMVQFALALWGAVEWKGNCK